MRRHISLYGAEQIRCHSGLSLTSTGHSAESLYLSISASTAFRCWQALSQTEFASDGTRRRASTALDPALQSTLTVLVDAVRSSQPATVTMTSGFAAAAACAEELPGASPAPLRPPALQTCVLGCRSNRTRAGRSCDLPHSLYGHLRARRRGAPRMACASSVCPIHQAQLWIEEPSLAPK